MCKKEVNPYLVICGDLVAQKLDMPAISHWSNANYIVLSEAILKKTKIYVSKNTLKRVFGKLKTSESYRPQKATLNALAQFVGYVDWDELISKEVVPLHFEQLAEEKAIAGFAPPSTKITIPVTQPVIFTVLAIIFLLVVILLMRD